jgi:YrbI family 3-deoxy-D-manno-octulosonate 8-phosphate phosphatase
LGPPIESVELASAERESTGDALKRQIKETRLVAFDFDGVFTDNTVIVSEDGAESVRCHRGDGIGLRKLDRLGIGTVIISTEENPVVTARSRKLKVRCVQGSKDKLAALQVLVEEMGISLSQVAFVGNDVNDLTCLRSVGLPIVVRDAHPDVVSFAMYKTRTDGGFGAVREVCDLYEAVLGESQE